MGIEQKTVSGRTETSDGPIPHFIWNGIQCPVKVQVSEKENSRGELVRTVVMRDASAGYLPVPLYRDGCLVFALPGGGEICPSMRKSA